MREEKVFVILITKGKQLKGKKTQGKFSLFFILFIYILYFEERKNVKRNYNLKEETYLNPSNQKKIRIGNERKTTMNDSCKKFSVDKSNVLTYNVMLIYKYKYILRGV